MFKGLDVTNVHFNFIQTENVDHFFMNVNIESLMILAKPKYTNFTLMLFRND